jgi:hypothetical protein
MKLELLSGEISNLIVVKGSIPLLSPVEKNLAETGAATAAAIGESLSSTFLVGASTETEMGMEFFTCTVSGEELTGCFNKVEFKNDQYIDFVVAKDRVNSVQAARDPYRHLIWTMPHRAKGHAAQKRSNIFGSVVISSATAMFIFMAGYFTEENSRPLRLESAVFQALISFTLTLIICFFVCRRVYGDGNHATKIFMELGFSDPANVNLPQGDRKARRHRMAEVEDAEIMDVPWRFHYDKSEFLRYE